MQVRKLAQNLNTIIFENLNESKFLFIRMYPIKRRFLTLNYHFKDLKQFIFISYSKSFRDFWVFFKTWNYVDLQFY